MHFDPLPGCPHEAPYLVEAMFGLGDRWSLPEQFESLAQTLFPDPPRTDPNYPGTSSGYFFGTAVDVSRMGMQDEIIIDGIDWKLVARQHDPGGDDFDTPPHERGVWRLSFEGDDATFIPWAREMFVRLKMV